MLDGTVGTDIIYLSLVLGVSNHFRAEAWKYGGNHMESWKPVDGKRKIGNIGAKECLICMSRTLSSRDSDIFYREVDFEEYLPFANENGYRVPFADFDRHMRKHIKVVD